MSGTKGKSGIYPRTPSMLTGKYIRTKPVWNKGKSGVQASTKKGKSLEEFYGIERWQEIREKMSGKNNHGWKGGITPLIVKIRCCLEMRMWKFSILQRDNYTCQECGLRSGLGKSVFLEVDHIKIFSKIIEDNEIATFEQAQSCLELWDISNGRTLCVECHNRTKQGRVENFKWYVRQKRNDIQRKYRIAKKMSDVASGY